MVHGSIKGSLEQKETENVSSLKKTITDIKLERNELSAYNIQLKQQITDLNQKINIFKQQNNTVNTNNISLTQEVTTLKERINTLTTQNKTFNTNNIKLAQNVITLQTQNNRLLDDKKEMEMKIFDLEKENAKLKASNLDYSKVFCCIMSCVNNGLLNEYESDIKKETFESEYTGLDLKDIELDHIRLMGIKKIKLRNIVFKSVKKLIQNKGKANFEGINDVPTAYI